MLATPDLINKAFVFIILTWVINSDQTELTFMDGDRSMRYYLLIKLSTDDIRTSARYILNENRKLNKKYKREIEAYYNRKTCSILTSELFNNASKLIKGINYNKKQITKKVCSFYLNYKTDSKYLEQQFRQNAILGVYMNFELGRTFTHKQKIQARSNKCHDLNRFSSILTLFTESFSSFYKIKEVLIRFDSFFLLFRDLSARLQNETSFKGNLLSNTLHLEGLPEIIEGMQSMFCGFFEYTKLKNTEGLYKILYDYKQTGSIILSCNQGKFLDHYNDYEIRIEKLFELCNLFKRMFDETLEKCNKTCEYFENNVKHLSKVKRQLTYKINKIKTDNTKNVSENLVFCDMLLDMNDILWIILLEFHFLNKVTIEFTFERLHDCDAKRKYYSSLIVRENNCIIRMCFLHKYEYFKTESFKKALEKDLESSLDSSKLEILVKCIKVSEKNKVHFGETFKNEHDIIFRNLKFKTYFCYIRLFKFLEKTNQYTVSTIFFNNTTFASDLKKCAKKFKKNILCFERSYTNDKDAPNDDGIQKIVDYANDSLNNLILLESQKKNYSFACLNFEVKRLKSIIHKRMVNLLQLDLNVDKFLKYKLDQKCKNLFCAIRFYDKISLANQNFVEIITKIPLQIEKNDFDLIRQCVLDLTKIINVLDAIDLKIEQFHNLFPFLGLGDLYDRSQIESQIFALTQSFIAVIDLSYKYVLEKCFCIYQGAVMPNKEQLAKTINKIHSEGVIIKTFYIFLTRFITTENQTLKDKIFLKYIKSPYYYINIQVLMDIDKNSVNDNKNTSEKSYLYNLDDRVQNIVKFLRYLLVFDPKLFISQFETLILKYLKNAEKSENDYYHMFQRLIALNRNKKKLSNLVKETNGKKYQFNMNYEDIRFDEVKLMVEHFLELSNITIILSDLEDKKLRDQYFQSHNFLLNIEEKLPLALRTGGCKISNRNISISGIYTVIQVNMEQVASMIYNESTPCNLEYLKTLIDKMELVTSKIYILYDLEHVIQGIKKNITNEKSNDYQANLLFEIYHKHSIHANLGLYFSKCLLKKLPNKASEWNLTIHAILHKYFLEFNLTSINLIRAFGFKPFEHTKYLNEIKGSVIKNIYGVFNRLLQIELDQFLSTSKDFDDDLVSCLRQIVLAYNTLAQYIIVNEEDDCKKFIDNFIQQKINFKIIKSGDTIYKEIEEFEQISEVSVDIINIKLNTLLESLADLNSENNEFIVLFILLNMRFSKDECIFNLIDKLYVAISKQMPNICRFKSNETYNKCLSYIIKLEDISKYVNYKKDRDLVYEIQVSWLLYLHRRYKQINKHIVYNWNCKNDDSISNYIQEGKEVLHKICLMYHPKHPHDKRHLCLSPVPRVILYECIDLILNCLIFQYSANLNDCENENSPFDIKIRQETEIFLYKAKLGFFDGLFEATLVHFKQASYLRKSIKDLKIILEYQFKPIKFLLHYINNSSLEMIRIQNKNTDFYTTGLINAITRALKQLSYLLYNYNRIRNQLNSEEKCVNNIFGSKMAEWYNESRNKFDCNLSVLIKNSYKNATPIDIKKLYIELLCTNHSDPVEFACNCLREIRSAGIDNRCGEHLWNYECIAKFVNNAIDYQKITLQEVCSNDQVFTQIKISILNKNNRILARLKKSEPLISTSACEEINNTFTVDTIYYIIENALDNQFICIITDGISSLNHHNDLTELEERAFTILNNIEICIKKWKIQVKTAEINTILNHLNHKTKVNIISSIETSIEKFKFEKMELTVIKKNTNDCKEVCANNISMLDENVQLLIKIKEKIFSIDFSMIKDLNNIN